MFTEMLMYLGISLLSALGLVILGKFILQNIIRRPTDYYEIAEKEQEDIIMEPIRKAEREGKN